MAGLMTQIASHRQACKIVSLVSRALWLFGLCSSTVRSLSYHQYHNLYICFLSHILGPREHRTTPQSSRSLTLPSPGGSWRTVCRGRGDGDDRLERHDNGGKAHLPPSIYVESKQKKHHLSKSSPLCFNHGFASGVPMFDFCAPPVSRRPCGSR